MRYLGGMVRLQPTWSLVQLMQCTKCGAWSDEL
jgi:hypothetical protein